jgi:hypothetical protein
MGEVEDLARTEHNDPVAVVPGVPSNGRGLLDTHPSHGTLIASALGATLTESYKARRLVGVGDR